MMEPISAPQSQISLQAVDNGDTSPIIEAESNIAEEEQQQEQQPNHQPQSLYASPPSSPSSPTRISLASPAPSTNIGGGLADNNSDLTNFMKYGSIRPPVSALQDVFIEQYRLWREHAEPLEWLDGLTGREQSSDVWTRHMAYIQILYAKYHNSKVDGIDNREYHGNEHLFEPRNSNDSSSSSSAAAAAAMYNEQTCEDASDEEQHVSVIEHHQHISGGEFERRQLERLASLMFRPGAKLFGMIEVQRDTTRSGYELVVMEGDVFDELGEPKGVLARHKFAGDEQCVFVKLSFVPVPGNHRPQEEEEKQSIEDEVKSKEEKDADIEDRSTSVDQKRSLSDKITIQMEYADGDHVIHGVWNHKTLCFEGTVKKLSENQGEANEMGGTIISRLIHGRSSFGDSGSSDELPPSNRVENTSSRRSSSPNVDTRTFTLSPCTHLHPRGIAPAPLWVCLVSETLSRMGLLCQVEGSTNNNSIVLGGANNNTTQLSTAIKKSTKGKGKAITPEKRKILLDEIASHDNYKLVLHRARTDALRREILKKLVELGTVLDFAELARKRNVAKRREKWRGRVRKCTPRPPRRLFRRNRTSSTTTGTVEEFDLSKDVQKKKVQFYDQLAVISWGDLLEEAAIQAEKTCAIFRRQTALLDNMTFESDEYKAQVMADLRANGLTLASSHSEWDKCIQGGRTVALGWSWFERGSWSCFERSAVVGKRCVYLLFQMHSRLESNHKHLEKSFREADGRLTDAQLEKIKSGSYKSKGKSGGEDEADGLCGVCQCDMDEEGEDINDVEGNHAVCLPCSHTFHWKCIREWLHNHPQCPICRVDLNTL